MFTSDAHSLDPLYQKTTLSITEKILLSHSELTLVPDYHQVVKIRTSKEQPIISLPSPLLLADFPEQVPATEAGAPVPPL